MSLRHQLLWALLMTWPCTAAAAPPLTLCYEDVAQRPWSMPDGTGLNFELLKAVEKQLGENFIYAAKPWRRCLEELRLGAVDAAIGAADGPERRRYAVYPTRPDGSADPARALFEDDVNVFLRVGGQASWDGHRLYIPNRQVAVQSGYMIGNILRERGFQTRELVKSADDGLRLLVSGMFDVAVLQGSEASQLARTDPRFQGRVLQAPEPYMTLDFYLPVNRARYARDPQRITAIWRAIETVRASADYRQHISAAGQRP